MSASSFRADLLVGHVALVCGGTSGIGAAIGSALAALGAEVTVSGATPAEADAARERAGFIGNAIALDVRDDEGIQTCMRQFARLDILVNCAGVIRRGAEHDPKVFAEVVDINLTGTMRLRAASRPLLTGSAGCIVNMASMYSFFGGPHAPGYTASKGGIAQLTKALAVAYAADKIRVNAIAPGWIATPFTALSVMIRSKATPSWHARRSGAGASRTTLRLRPFFCVRPPRHLLLALSCRSTEVI